ncbi:MAG: amidohydrolase family protein, partial [Chloroflexi bacterium]|nr:amidohydrolase family protein [Chloroflexota bacterium]
KAMVQPGNTDSPLADIWAADHQGDGHDIDVIESWAQHQEEVEEATQSAEAETAESRVSVTRSGAGTRLIVKAGWLIDGTGAPAERDMAVAIEDGQIAWMGSSRELRPDIADAQVIDASGATLLPGLIDGHVHLMCPAAAERAAAEHYTAMTDEQLVLRAVNFAQEGLWAGVTTMRDLGSRGFLLTTVRDEIAAGRLVGPRLIVAGPAVTTTGGHFWYMGYEADTMDDLLKAVRHLHKGGVDWIKVMATGGHTTAGSNPGQVQYTADQLRAVVEDAHRLGHQVTAHVHAVEGIRNAVEAGVDCLEHCSWLGPSGPAYDRDLAMQIADKGIYVSIAMSGRPLDDRNRSDAERLRLYNNRKARYESIASMMDLDCRVVDSSDAGMVMNFTRNFAQTLVPLVKQVEMRPEAAICSATGMAAEALGLSHEIGTIRPGIKADLLLVAGDASRDITALQRVLRVWKDGKPVVQRDVAPRIGLETPAEEAQAAQVS